MSSHREAPEISQDPVADNTDTYAFVSPDAPDTVTILANYIPLEAAAGGPNFYQFGDDVKYYIYVSNNRTGVADLAYEFQFTTHIRDENMFLYNTGPISSIYDSTFNRYQTYTVTRIEGAEPTDEDATNKAHTKAERKLKTTVLARDLHAPPCNIGPASTPNYPALAQEAIHSIDDGIKVFAGQRNDGFFADLGAVFDLGDLRPFQDHHAYGTMAAASGIDALKNVANVHTIALQIPITQLTRNHSRPTDVMSPDATIGVWAAASRRQMMVRGDQYKNGSESGPWVQVSRLGNPLFNELLVGIGRKDQWNRSYPIQDKYFASGALHPVLGELLPSLYPGVFPNLQALDASKKPRADIEAIFLTGLPAGIVPGFQNNTGKVIAEMLRLNVAIPPSATPNSLGLLGGDAAGFPNGRRVIDDIVTVELRALAGVTYALVDKSFTPDAAAGQLTQGVAEPTSGAPGTGAPNAARFLTTFPYLGSPYDGFDVPPAEIAGPTTTTSPAPPTGVLGLARR